MKSLLAAAAALWMLAAPAMAATCPKNGQGCTNALSTDGNGNVISPSTADNQATANGSLATIVSQTVGLATSALQTAANATLGTISSTLTAISANVATAANQVTANATLSSILSALGAPLPAGTAVIGKVGIDQTTPGTTNAVALSGALPAGTNSIGGVTSTPNSANYQSVVQSQTVTAFAYSNGVTVGSKISFTAMPILAGFVQKVVISLPDPITPSLNLYLFKADPTSTVITDQATFAGVNSADFAKLVAIIPVSSCVAGSATATCEALIVNTEFDITVGTTLYGALIAASTFTPVITATPWNVKIGLAR